jgi:hypothetical protein
MKIWLAHLSGRQRSSQISSKEVERIGARLLIAPVARPLRILTTTATRTHVGYSNSLFTFHL